jgi:hypothetical protein
MELHQIASRHLQPAYKGFRLIYRAAAQPMDGVATKSFLGDFGGTAPSVTIFL